MELKFGTLVGYIWCCGGTKPCIHISVHLSVYKFHKVIHSDVESIRYKLMLGK